MWYGGGKWKYSVVSFKFSVREVYSIHYFDPRKSQAAPASGKFNSLLTWLVCSVPAGSRRYPVEGDTSVDAGAPKASAEMQT